MQDKNLNVLTRLENYNLFIVEAYNNFLEFIFPILIKFMLDYYILVFSKSYKDDFKLKLSIFSATL